MQDKKKLTILLVLIIGALIIWRPKGKEKRGPTLSERPAVTSEKSIANQRPLERKRTEFTDWGRNPFAWARSGAGIGVSDFSLSGIIWDKEASYAIINGAVVHPGDEIAGKTVKRIEPNRVILTDGSKDYILELE